MRFYTPRDGKSHTVTEGGGEDREKARRKDWWWEKDGGRWMAWWHGSLVRGDSNGKRSCDGDEELEEKQTTQKKGEMQEFQQTETNKGTGDALRRKKKKKHTNKKV